MTLALEEAQPPDLPAIAALMNRAYRGVVGWATEAAYITGARASAVSLAEELARAPDSRLLVTRDADRTIVGCVRLEPASGETWYLGSLTVEPALQAGGLGRRLLAAGEAWALARGGRTIKLTVVHVRAGLIAWYERRGYALIAETQPWPYGDDRFGVPLRDDLRFVVLEKRIG